VQRQERDVGARRAEHQRVEQPEVGVARSRSGQEPSRAERGLSRGGALTLRRASDNFRRQ
jgi:hypothetical protein